MSRTLASARASTPKPSQYLGKFGWFLFGRNVELRLVVEQLAGLGAVGERGLDVLVVVHAGVDVVQWCSERQALGLNNNKKYISFY